MSSFQPGWLAFSLGSVPFADTSEAWDAILRSYPYIPSWPQLPRRTYRENLYAQFSERFPGITLEDQRIYVDRRKDLDPGLEQLYLAYLENDIEAETGGRFLFTDDVGVAAREIVAHLDSKREARKLAPMLYEGEEQVGDAAAHRAPVTYEMPKGVVALGCGKAQTHSQSRPPTE